MINHNVYNIHLHAYTTLFKQCLKIMNKRIGILECNGCDNYYVMAITAAT